VPSLLSKQSRLPPDFSPSINLWNFYMRFQRIEAAPSEHEPDDLQSAVSRPSHASWYVPPTAVLRT